MKRYHQKLAKKISLRTHIVLILVGTAVFGFALGRVLLHMGVLRPVVRILVVMPASYGFFFVLIKMWIASSHGPGGHPIISNEDLEEVPSERKQQKTGSASSTAWEGLDALTWIPEFGEAFFISILVLVVCGAIIGTLYWVLVEGPLVLSDAAFEVALTASLFRAAKRMSQRTWAGSVLQNTILPFALIYFLSTLAIAVMQASCPGQPTLHLIVKSCWNRKK